MFSQNTPRRDAFTFSLGGMTALGGFTGIPAIDADRLNKPCEERPETAVANWTQKALRPLWRRRRAA